MSKPKPTDKELLEVTKWFAEQVVEFNRSRTFLDFQNDVQLNLASTMAIIQMAENAKNVSAEVKDRHSDFPWRKIVGLRNIITHNYSGVSMDIVWEAINEHLPELVEQMNDILKHDVELLHDDELTINRYEFKNLEKLSGGKISSTKNNVDDVEVKTE